MLASRERLSTWSNIYVQKHEGNPGTPNLTKGVTQGRKYYKSLFPFFNDAATIIRPF